MAVKAYRIRPEARSVTSSPAVESEGLQVRRAEQRDLYAIQRIERRSFPNPWPEGTFERFLGEPGFLVADDDGSVVGFIVADVIASHGRAIGHIKDLAVDPNSRGEGIGSTLLARALMVLTGGGVDSVKLEVREDNESARKLYRQFGFEPVHALPNYYENGEEAVVLVSELRQ